ncbi:MAG TPA: hypothetical protein VKA89_04240 [Solirubrobacterales bacterium]|nr:hypothetical protein [Solirubrobacterales bacterium]
MTRTRYLLPVAVLAAGAVALLLVLQSAADEQPDREPLMLLLAPSGFLLPQGEMVDAKRVSRAHGFRSRQYIYPLGDPLEAWRAVRHRAELAREIGRDVYVYGESAGGTLAALLAKRDVAEAAVANSAPVDLPKFNPNDLWGLLGTPPGVLRRLSPVNGPTENPVLLLASPDDGVVFWGPARAWAKRDPMVRFHGFLGEHVKGDRYEANLQRAFDWLQRRQAGAESS